MIFLLQILSLFTEKFKPINKYNGNYFIDWYISTEEIIGDSN